MGASRIEQIIEDIYNFVESCKPQMLSQSKVVVPRDELYDLLDELRLRTPDEIKRYQKIINNRDAIIKDAEENAAKIIEAAKKDAEALLNENEIIQQAFARANEMISEAAAQSESMMSSAERDADQIRTGALAYANEILAEIENTLSNTFESTRAKSEMMLETIKGNLDIVVNNRKELNGEATDVPPEKLAVAELKAMEEERENDAASFDEEDIRFDEDTFINNI